jgi:2-polyprenyl-3-methyl-5-hydroxy-6-metoxy-1,4-benzoquinol methylase
VWKFRDFCLRNYDEKYYRIYEKAWQVDLDRIPSFHLLKKFLDPHPGERILDAGCGTGHLLHYLINGSAATGSGVDFSKAALKTATDQITCFNVIEHVAEQDRVMDEFKRVLKNKGLLAIGTNIKDSFAWRLYQLFIGEHTHVKEFSVKEFLSFLRRHFDVVAYRKSSGVFRFGPPISWIFHHLFLGDIIALCRNRA